MKENLRKTAAEILEMANALEIALHARKNDFKANSPAYPLYYETCADTSLVVGRIKTMIIAGFLGD